VPKAQREADEREPPAGEEVSHFINNLVPSFLKIDTQGRVIHLDTFSKVCPSSLRQTNRHTLLLPIDNRAWCEAWMVYLQPAVRRTTGTHRGDVDAEPMRT
jgi:hypothetical protein